MKNMISIFAALAAFAAFGVTPNTEWQDVPGTDKVGEVLSAGGAVTTEADPVWNAQKSGYQPRLVSGTNIKTVNGNSLLGSGNIKIENGIDTNAVRDIVREQLATNGIRKVDGAARPLPKYLHALDFADSYPDAAQEYYRSRGDGKTDGGCSAVRDGGFLYRNYDWKFDDAAEFVIRMSAGPNRFASVGVANVGTNITEAMATSGKQLPPQYYKALPGRFVDGINENGVAVEVNVVDGDVDYWDNPNGDIHPLGAVRWVLDHATNALHAATELSTRIKFPEGWTQNFHWMIADKDETYIVEDGTNYLVTGKAVMTNFKLYPAPVFGQGWERYQLLTTNLTASITNVWFTRAYADDTEWLSEFADREEMNAAKIAWDNGKGKESHRGQHVGNKWWWQSVHTSIYNLTDLTLKIAVQETDDWYTFAVPSAGGVKVETDPTVPEWAKQANPPEGMTDNALVWTNNSVKTKNGSKTVTANDVGAYTKYNSLGVNGDGQVIVHEKSPWANDGITFDCPVTFGTDYTPHFYCGLAVGGWTYTGSSFVSGNKIVTIPSKNGTIALTSDIPDGMPTTGLVWNATAGKVKTADGAKTIGAADVGAWGNIETNNYKMILLKYGERFYFPDEQNPLVEAYGPGITVELTSYGDGANVVVTGGGTVRYAYLYKENGVWKTSQDFTTMTGGAAFGFGVIGTDWEGSYYNVSLPSGGAQGYFAIEGWSSLSAMLDDAAQQQTRSAAGTKVMTLIDQPVSQKINNAVSANLNTYIDGDTGVEYVGKFYGGSLYYVPTGNVYPPNN